MCCYITRNWSRILIVRWKCQLIIIPVTVIINVDVLIIMVIVTTVL
jgi:hypothetical protein